MSVALTTRDERRIPSLDGLRAISITMVVLAHAAGGPGFAIPRAVAQWVHGLGELGVRVFFVISGFLITSILVHELESSRPSTSPSAQGRLESSRPSTSPSAQGRLESSRPSTSPSAQGRLDKRRTISLSKFYFRRTLRLFPAFYVYVLTIVILQSLKLLQLAPYDVLHAVTYTMNYHRARAWWLGHCWSLSVEEQFYFLWPAILIVLGRRRGLMLAAAFVILGTAIRLGSWFAFPATRDGIGETFPTVGDAIAVGCVLGGLRGWLATQPWWLRWQKSPLALLAPLMIIGAYSTWPWQRINFVIAPTTIDVGIALCISWCIDNGDGVVGRVLNARPLVIVGIGSYSIYLWQQLFLKHDGTWAVQRFPLNVVMVALVAALSYFLVEKPFLRLRERIEPKLFKRKTTS